MMKFDFLKYRNKPVTLNGNMLEIADDLKIPLNETLDCGEPVGQVPVADIAQLSDYYRILTNGHSRPQLAALVFNAGGNYRALDWYFPITATLNNEELKDFYRLAESLLQHSGLDLRLFGENRTDLTTSAKADILFIVAGQIAEIFYYRRDILHRFLNTPRHIWLYITPRAFEQDGGLAGGDYNHDTESVQLVLSRLYEGYYGQTPGVAPFLHEFGHMLDFFDAGTGKMGNSEGLLPGLNPKDGEVFTPRARELFIQGKKLELERYLLRYNGNYTETDPLPVGHPYVFQNDTEFVAGYFEMFFRNPNYFASQNPLLYQSLSELFNQDPRRAWPQDFPFYVNENRKFYLNSGEKPWETHITLPA